jgi:hypothetical protein
MRAATAFTLAAFLTTPALAASPQQDLLTASGLHAGGVFAGDISYLMFDPDNVDIDTPQRFNAGILSTYGKPLSPNFSFQLDSALDAALQSDDTDNQTMWEGTFGGHLSWRDPSSHLLGVFGGGGFSIDGGDNGGPSTFYFAGVEGQAYFNQLTLQAQVGFLDGQDKWLETIDNAYFMRGVASYYFKPNTKLSVEVSFLHGSRPNNDPDSGGVIDLPGWGIRLDQAIGNSGGALFASWNGYDFRTTEESDAPWVNEFKVGFVKRFGSSSILDNDRNGAGLDLPSVGRWTSISANEIE